ncbi:hypothetical protein, partial [Rothia mucilaginosa]
MPTGSNPTPPANPYAEGTINPGSNKESKTSQIVEATNKSHSATEKEGAQAKGTPAGAESQQSAEHTDQAEKITTHQNSNGGSLNFRNLFSKSPRWNWILFLIALASLSITICHISTIYNISIKHL